VFKVAAVRLDARDGNSERRAADNGGVGGRRRLTRGGCHGTLCPRVPVAPNPSHSSLMPQRVASPEERLRKSLGDTLLTQEPLRHHTTFRIGGPADFYFAARTPDEMVTALRTARDVGLPAFLLGGGSNLLVSDEGFRGLVVRNAIEQVEFDHTAAHVGAGVDFLQFIYECRDRSLSGLEFAAGIPGSIGGALYGNAGCYGQDIGSFTIECTHTTLDGAVVETRPAPWYQFAYRDSRLKREPRVLLSCLLQLKRGDPAAIQAVIDEKLEIRRQKHPQWRVEPTAGSYFKNLPPHWPMPGAQHPPRTPRGPPRHPLHAGGGPRPRPGDPLA